MKSRVCGYFGLNLLYHNRTAFSLKIQCRFPKSGIFFRIKAATEWFGTCLYLVLFQISFSFTSSEVKLSFGRTALLKINEYRGLSEATLLADLSPLMHFRRKRVCRYYLL